MILDAPVSLFQGSYATAPHGTYALGLVLQHIQDGTVVDNGMRLVGRSTPLPLVRQTACCDPVILSAVRQGLSDAQGRRGVPRRVAISRCPTNTWILLVNPQVPKFGCPRCRL
jgi:hypothetical protein